MLQLDDLQGPQMLVSGSTLYWWSTKNANVSEGGEIHRAVADGGAVLVAAGKDINPTFDPSTWTTLNIRPVSGAMIPNMMASTYVRTPLDGGAETFLARCATYCAQAVDGKDVFIWADGQGLHPTW